MDKKFYLNIQMFAEGGAEGSAEGTSQMGLTGDFTADFDRYVLGKESAPVSQEAEYSDDVGGTEAEDEEEAAAGDETAETDENAEENPDAEFEELIKGKYKEAFHRRTQGIINGRFKTAKETERKLGLASDALAPLFDRYGLDEGDFEGLKSAVKGDAGIFAKKALEKGMESEEYRDAFNADRDRKQQEAQQDLTARQKAAKQKYQEWKTQETDIQKTYPGFNLEKAFANDNFRRMAMKGESLLDAYRASHFEEIAAGLVAAATKRAAKKAVDSMQGNISRPAEGGMNSAGGTVMKKDVGSLTGKDIDDIIKRVGRGEIVAF